MVSFSTSKFQSNFQLSEADQGPILRHFWMCWKLKQLLLAFLKFTADTASRPKRILKVS